MDFEKTPLQEQIKRIANYRGLNMNQLREAYNEKFGTNYIQQSFSKKINRGAIRLDELEQFADLLGFNVKLELVNAKGGENNGEGGGAN